MTPAIIVPYRDRREHLEQFIPHMVEYLNSPEIYIVEQQGDEPFNRAALINYGAMYAQADYFVAHDVDHLPISVDYTPQNGVTQLAKNEIQTKDFLGAATMFDLDTFIKIGGYNGDYFCRGEDNELFFQLKRLSIKIQNRPGRFNVLPHPRPWREFDPLIWNRAKLHRTKNYLEELKRPICVILNEHYTHLKIVL